MLFLVCEVSCFSAVGSIQCIRVNAHVSFWVVCGTYLYLQAGDDGSAVSPSVESGVRGRGGALAWSWSGRGWDLGQG